jgi:hypothetical protein
MNRTKEAEIVLHSIRSNAAVAASLVARVFLSMASVILFSAKGIAVEQPQTHLFILSGQSNMTGGLKIGFSRVVEEHFGKDNVTVVHHSKSGRGIRFWDKDYRFPKDYQIPGKGPPSERTKQQHGEVYGPLIELVRQAREGRSHDTITFIWMQGESDGMRGLGAVYEESFLRLLGRLKTDLQRKEIGFVIGRINDAPLNGPTAAFWRQVRDVQVKLATNAPHGDWIDTDDFSSPDAGVHFPRDKYPAIGVRFATKSIELIGRIAAKSIKEH